MVRFSRRKTGKIVAAAAVTHRRHCRPDGELCFLSGGNVAAPAEEVVAVPVAETGDSTLQVAVPYGIGGTLGLPET